MSTVLVEPTVAEPPTLELEREWSEFFRGLNDCKRHRIRDVEAELHELFITGQVNLAEVFRYLDSFGEGGS